MPEPFDRRVAVARRRTASDPAGYAGTASALLRELFVHWGLDASNAGTDRWNPLGQLIPAGSRVAIKPNWVYHAPRSPGTMDSLVTHTGVIQAVLEYVAMARPSAVVIGDAPLQGCDFGALRAAAGLGSLETWARERGLPLEIVDFRRTVNPDGRPGGEKIEDARPLSRFVEFDLGDESSLRPLDADADKFRVTAYNPDLMAATHRPGSHKYLIAREILEAGVVINVPKLKCHMKACLTGALKNLVGINGHKEYLPHHRKGGSGGGGDCYAGDVPWKTWMEDALDTVNRGHDAGVVHSGLERLVVAGRKFAAFAGADDNLEGAWYGNDTIWRTCLDLNRILLYGTADGRLEEAPGRTVIHITDAIVAGEGEGPLKASPVEAGFLTGALNGAAADYVHARLMGFDPEKIPIVREAFERRSFPLAPFPASGIVVRNGAGEERGSDVKPLRRFAPPRGWRGHCELDSIHEPVDPVLARV